MVGPPPVASSVARARTMQRLARAHVEHQHAGEFAAVGARDEIERAMILQTAHVAPPHLLGQAG